MIKRFTILVILAGTCYCGMACFAHRNYVQPMFLSIAMPMVVLFCLRRAVMTLQILGRWNFANSNSMRYSVPSFKSVRVLCFMSFLCFQEKLFAFFALAKSLLRGLSFFALAISFYCCFAVFGFSVSCHCFSYVSFALFSLAMTLVCVLSLFALTVSFFSNLATFGLPVGSVIRSATSFTERLVAVGRPAVFVKFRKRQNLLALGALFCYSYIKHGFFLVKKLCCGPVIAHTVTGSFHNNTYFRNRKVYLLFLLIATGHSIGYFPSITSFNAGQVSPLLEARADFAKYRSSSRLLENFFVAVQGPVLKRPGTKYIATVKTGSVRVIPFEFSTDDAYVIETGNLYMRFYRNGGQILDGSDDPVEIVTVFATDELFDIQYVQTDNDTYFADGSDPPQVLTRADHDDWTIADVTFTNGPFLPENETTTTITPTSYGFTADAGADTFTITGSGDLSSIFTDGKEFLVSGSTANDGTWTVSSTTFAGDPAFVIAITTDITSGVNDGTILIVGGTVTLTASAAIFETTSGATHVGSIWAINQVRGNSVLSGSFSDNGTSLSSPFFTGSYGFTTSGNSDGTITLQRSTNNGISWRAALAALTNVDFDNPAEIEDDGAIYRIVMSNYGSGTPTFTFTITDDTNRGVVEITALTSTTVATGTIIANLVTTDSTTTWREPYWSDFRGWPQAVAFHQQRLVYGGSATYPQTVWFGKQDPDDYPNFLEGTLDTSAFTVALEGQNPIRWLLSQDYLLIGTSGSCGKWGEQGKAVTPTSPSYQEQTRYGSATQQAVLAGDLVLYIERGDRRIREFGFDLQVDKYLSPDLTVLSPEITDSGIVDIAFQLRPSPILWCVLADGEIATMTFQKDQSVIAWTKQITDGDFESVTVISSGAGEDEVWVSVERNGTRFIEQFQPHDWGDQEDAWFVDSGLDYDSTATTSFSGLDHLDSKIVAVWADAIVLESERVSSGAITIDVSSGRVIVGLPFTAKLETLPLRIDPQDATLNKHIKRLWIDVVASGPYSFGNGPDSDLTEVVGFGDASVTAVQSFHTSVVKLQQFPFVYGGRVKQTVYIESSKPVPLGIRSIEADVEVRR